MSKKLLRLHTTDFNSIFDCVFNEEIKINPYSEIALHSASFPIANRFLVVDSTNDEITFQVQNGASHTIPITHDTYTKFNATNLLEAITNSMNQDLDITTSKEHGTEISIHLNNDTRVSIEFGYENQLVVSSTARDSASYFNSPKVSIPSRGNTIIVPTAGDESDNNNTNYIIGEVPFTRGCGNFKFDLSHYTTGGTATKAITFGLIPVEVYDKYKTGTPTIADVANSEWKYAHTIPAHGQPGAITQGSQVAMNLSKGKISFNEYKTDNSINNLAEFEFDYTDLGNKNYYPAIILHKSTGFLKIKNLKYSASPFTVTDPTRNLEVHLDDDLGTSLPAPFGKRATIYNFTFGSISLRDYLGFTESNLNPLGVASQDRRYQAEHHFTNVTSSDNYIIEMLNIKLDSYDSFTPNNVGGGRKNILAPIPISEQIIDNQTGLVQYEPANFNFISMNNEYALNLRNIRMRIIDFQHAPVLNSGFASVNIIIRDSRETAMMMKK